MSDTSESSAPDGTSSAAPASAPVDQAATAAPTPATPVGGDSRRKIPVDAAVIELGSSSPPIRSDDRNALNDMEDHRQGINFNKVKLSVEDPGPRTHNQDDVEFGGLRRDRQFGASMRSTTSTKSRVSLSPHRITSDYAAKNLFCYRSSAIEKAVEDCKTTAVVHGIDGEVKGYWLLTEIDHWDLEKEKLVLLTSNSLLVIKYDFVALKPNSCKRIALNIVSYVEIGDFFYPQYSIMPSREHGGFRIHWGTYQPTFTQRWNPFCEDIGFITFTHHLLAYNEKEKETVTFDVADLADSIVAAVNMIRNTEHRNEPLTVHNRPIVIDSYASLTSMVYNQSHIGFSMERGGVSF